MEYDVIIIGAGPGGIFSAFELMKKSPETRVAVFEEGNTLEKRKCPIDGKKVKSCIKCPTCAIMNGFGGAGAFSDGKYNITNDFGGTLYEYIGRDQAINLMKYVDTINTSHGGEETHMYSTAGTKFKTLCMQNKLKLLDASVRHLGTDINYVVLENMYNEMKDHIDFYFNTPVSNIEVIDGGYRVFYKDEYMDCENVLFPLVEAEANGLKMSVRSLRFQPSLTVLISVCELSFRLLYFHILQMSCTKVRLYTEQRNSKIL